MASASAMDKLPHALATSLDEPQRAHFLSTVQKMQRDINCLSEDNKGVRRRALKSIKTQTIEQGFASWDHLAAEAVLNYLLKPLVRCYSDSSESCRETAVELLSDLLKVKPAMDTVLPYLIPIYVARLGQKTLTEPTEEIRLALMTQLEQVIVMSRDDNGIYIDELVQIFTRTIVDPFPEVMRLGCRCTALTAKAVPQRFHMASESLVAPLLTALNHQHSKVRNVSIRAIGATVQHGQSELLDKFRGPLSRRTMDHNPTVRKSLYTIAGRWLCEYRDRHSFYHKILPILLSGETDEVEDIATLAREAFIKAGRQFEEENRDRLKDHIDFGKDDAAPLGCRELVRENFSKILPGLLQDLTDWSAPNRIQASRLLYTLLTYEEKNITMHLGKTLEGLAIAVSDDEPDVAKMAVSCCKTIGRYTDCEAWVGVLAPHLLDVAASPRTLASHLIVTGALVESAPLDQLKQHGHTLTQALAAPNICESQELLVQEELMLVVRAVIHRFGMDVEPLAFDLFQCLVSVLAGMTTPDIAQDVEENLTELGIVQGMSAQQVYEEHTATLLEKLAPTSVEWTRSCFKRRVFTTLVGRAGRVLGTLLGQFMPIFVANCQPEKDIEVRNSFFSLLGKLLMTAPETLDSANLFHEYAPQVLKIIMPNMVWVAGERAQVLRQASTSCLLALLYSKLITLEHLREPMTELEPLLISLMEDESVQTRLITMQTLQLLIPLYKPAFIGSYAGYDLLHQLYPALLKRLDDSNNDVRLEVCRCFIPYFGCMHKGDGYDVQLYRAHTEAIFSGMLIHLDDENPEMQQGVYAALEAAADVNPVILAEFVKEDAVKDFRNRRMCQQLKQLCDEKVGK
eukprot:m.290894 g.290894  ORF g.290894 m.290894 type:complete len:854 (+) comp15821_c0_seq2:292-2853(+)